MNRDHCVKMAIVHDMAESLVGDITPVDGVDKSISQMRGFVAIGLMQIFTR